MDWSQHPDPLERRLDMTPPETARSNAALRDYAQMGAGRTLRDLGRKYAEQMSWYREQMSQGSSDGVAVKPPTASTKTLMSWSLEFEWQARVARWDILQQAKEVAAYEHDRIEARRMRLEAAKGAFNLMGQTLVLLQQNKMQKRVGPDGAEYPPLVVGETTLPQAIASLERAMTMLRKEFGDEEQRVDITSGGKPITWTDVVVERPR